MHKVRLKLISAGFTLQDALRTVSGAMDWLSNLIARPKLLQALQRTRTICSKCLMPC